MRKNLVRGFREPTRLTQETEKAVSKGELPEELIQPEKPLSIEEVLALQKKRLERMGSRKDESD